MTIISSGVWPINPSVETGTDLATHLNEVMLAINSQQASASRPPMITKGGVWTKTVGASDIAVMVYDGTTDYPIGSITGGVAQFGGATFATGATAAMPAVGVSKAGDFFYDTTTSQLMVFDGSAWKSSTYVRPNTNAFIKTDYQSSAFIKTGAGTASVKAGTIVELDGKFAQFTVDTAITMPALSAGTDYFVWVNQDGTIQAVADSGASPAAGSRKIGGFHYSPGGHSGSPAGGNSTPQINQYSFWDLKFKPESQDPRGMVLVANSFWSDIYLLGVDHIANGTSKYNVTIADGASPPKIPTAFGGDGATAYGSLNWWEASEVIKSHGKRLPSYGDFSALAYGTTEASSRGTDPGSTIWEPAYVSKWGCAQVSGNLVQWGSDFSFRPDGTATPWAQRTGLTGGRGDLYLYSDIGLVAAFFGGAWSNAASSGSRYSSWSNAPWGSGDNLGARGVCDHLILA